MGASSPLMSRSMLPSPISGQLRARLTGAALHETHEGFSGSRVFRVERDGQPIAYLKIARSGSADDLQPELARLLWLKHYRDVLPVPQVQCYSESGDISGDAQGDTATIWQYLLIEALPGAGIHDDLLRDRLPEVLAATAQALRRIHAVPIADCPFDMTLDVRIAQARWNLSRDWVDAGDFDAERQGRSAQSVYEELLAARPSDETEKDLVFTHGDYCAPNILLNPDTLALTGLIDWGRAGIADRCQDLALHARSIAYNFGAEWAEHFFHAYGLRDIDHDRMAFYRLLDEFF